MYDIRSQRAINTRNDNADDAWVTRCIVHPYLATSFTVAHALTKHRRHFAGTNHWDHLQNRTHPQAVLPSGLTVHYRRPPPLSHFLPGACMAEQRVVRFQSIRHALVCMPGWRADTP